MTVFAGIDLGTSGIKVGLVDETGTCLATAARRSPVQIPHPGWSEQDPEQWWTLTVEIFDELAARHPDLLRRLAGLSLSGHMLGQVLLNADDRPTTPCILWNDQRAIAECAELSARVPDIGRRANGQPDPGLTAPKLLWLAKHLPDALDRTDMLLLPKDYVRLKLTGTRLSEVSDASGTMMLDCASGTWDDELIAAAGWDRAKLPALVRSYDPAGDLRADLCRRWGCPANVAVAAGSGDNYAGALGIGAARPGRAALSIGTSGVLSAVDGAFHPAPERALLTTPHAAPDTYLSMAVVMSATQSLDWLATLIGVPAADLATLAERRASEGGIAGRPIVRPSLTGVRTPDNRPDASAMFGGVTAGHDRADLAYAILEGVAFQFFDGMRAQTEVGVPIDDVAAIGGGTRSLFWIALISALFDRPIAVPRDGDIAACLGAARLAMACRHPAERDAILTRRPQATATVDPDPILRDALLERFRRYRRLPFTLDDA
ncbi:MAG: xylulokinase [Pseudomonadota bacterium]